VASFRGAFSGSVLDVGSRSGNLKRVLPVIGGQYVGLDMTTPADVIGNVERGLPFVDAAFDAVVALDVLEHTDQIQVAFSELFRVARSHVVVALPNAFELKGRLRIVRGRHASGKYGLPIGATPDRHRWFFGFEEARRFCEHAVTPSGWRVRQDGALVGRRRSLLAPIVRRLPNLLAPSYLAWFDRVPRSEASNSSD
jgi:SAM-dependent methyltransferase